MTAITSSPHLLPLTDRASDRNRPAPAWIVLIRDAVKATDYGMIQIKVHEGEVVQIEATRKIRIPSNPTAPAEAQ